MRPLRLRCCGWAMKMFCAAVSRMRSVEASESAGKSNMVRPSASSPSAHCSALLSSASPTCSCESLQNNTALLSFPSASPTAGAVSKVEKLPKSFFRVFSYAIDTFEKLEGGCLFTSGNQKDSSRHRTQTV